MTGLSAPWGSSQMCQLPCKPPQKSFLPHGYRFYFSLPQASKDVPGCLSLCHLPGHHWKSPDCRHSAAVPQGGETGPSSGRLTETAQTRLVWTQQNLASPGHVGLPHSFCCKTGWGPLAFSSGGTATLVFGHGCSGAGMGSRDTTLS